MIQILPWMTRISSTGIPADLNVNSRTTSTIRIDRTDTTTLSRENEALKSCSDEESPTTYTSPSG